MPESGNSLATWKRLFRAALIGGQTPLFSDPSSSSSPSLGSLKSCPSPGLSCSGHGGSTSDTCCINYPGGQFALTQFWNSDPHAGPPGYLGPKNTWTVHGLWPDHCDGHFDSVCDCNRSGDCSSANYKCPRSSCNREYSSITNILEKFGQHDLLRYMGEHWKGINGDEHLWQHEWSKHGTCVSTLEPACYVNYTATQEVVQYFQKAVEVYKSLPSFEWLEAAGIVPSDEKTYTRAEIEAALEAPRGAKAIIQCDPRRPTELREIWYHFRVKGSLQQGEFVPSDPDFSGVGGSKDTCPQTGIRYLPKRDASDGPSPTATAPRPTGTRSPGAKGRLVVKLKDGGQRGCLISSGKWYNTVVGSSCALFHAHWAGDRVTLRSSKGPCGLLDDEFSCGPSAPLTPFQVKDGKLITGDGTSAWSADSVPRGTEQQVVYSTNDYDVQLDILWRQ
ncbi:uncharacterized protein PV09_04817 [Verruconis gallopava]|uniref:Ribonuclease T2-like n=1 Tax=Verruconis gallopava TaxID=253628 RepID=A0A0D1XN29_9PEZI|nr:uncharacterized protein PV09_04817 [Verruconis gallopava]KIW03986.1 hypothetical protein PV09_04817 [Verruconis gallopava]